MNKERSAGILVHRLKDRRREVLLAHPGGPFFARKDNGHWSIPKGWIEKNEDALMAAKREFEEETGLTAPQADYVELDKIIRNDGKIIWAWAIEADLNLKDAHSNTFELEWPPRSGKVQEFPEVDRIEWFDLRTASLKLQPVQIEFLVRLADKLGQPFHPEKPPQQGSLF